MNTPAPAHPPRVWIWFGEHGPCNVITDPEVVPLKEGVVAIPYLLASESDQLVRTARAEALESEINFWYGEHRGYVEAGMTWEWSLCEKHIMRLKEKAAEARKAGE